MARAIRAAAQAGLRRCWVLVPGKGAPKASTLAESHRLADSMELGWLAGDADLSALPPEPTLFIAGEQLVSPQAISASAQVGRSDEPGLRLAASPHDAAALADMAALAAEADLGRKAREIVAGTTKPGDGIVSRLINRPVSQAITRVLLRFPAIRPDHATLVTGLIALAMFYALVGLGGEQGLMLGAVLFQAASIFDGVDGEIARATFRTSHRGAMLDSLVDAATNLGFVGGVVFNLYIQGDSQSALLGTIGLALLTLGTILIGLRARRSSDPFSFNGVKDHYQARKSLVMTWLTWITMRDFYALAGAILLVCGLAAEAVTAFAIIVVGWFVVVIMTLARQAA